MGPTPFLNNKDYVISHEFACPAPFIDDLGENKKFIYPEWPKLNPSLYSKARRKYGKGNGSKSSKDITSNYPNLHSSVGDEPSITFDLEPSSQTITSTIISPLKNRNITPLDKDRKNNEYHGDEDFNIIRESDEEEEDDEVVVLQLGDFSKQNGDNSASNP